MNDLFTRVLLVYFGPTDSIDRYFAMEVREMKLGQQIRDKVGTVPVTHVPYIRLIFEYLFLTNYYIKKITNKIQAPMYASKQFVHLSPVSPNNMPNKVVDP